MKRFLITTVASLALVFGLIFGGATPALAVDVLQPVCSDTAATSQPTVCKDQQSAATSGNPLVGPKGLLTTYIRILSIVIGAAAVLMIMISGLRFITSQGDPQTVSSARNGVLYAGVGLVVAVLAQAMVAFVIARL